MHRLPEAAESTGRCWTDAIGSVEREDTVYRLCPLVTQEEAIIGLVQPIVVYLSLCWVYSR